MRLPPTITLGGVVSVLGYLAAVAVIEATGRPDWHSLSASPDAVAHGRVWLMLTSGLVVEGVVWAQLAVLAAVLGLALWRFGALRLWAVALAAHVGSALLAYAAVGVLWLVDASLVDVREPDYGISAVMAGELGALAAGGGRRTALLVGVLALAGFGIGLADASNWPANAEHLLGFAIGALTILLLDRRRLRPGQALPSAPCAPPPSATARSRRRPPRPRAGARRGARPRARRRPQRRGHAPAPGRVPGAAGLRRRTSRASSSPARSSRPARAPSASPRATA